MTPGVIPLDPETREFYIRTLTTLHAARVPFLVGGAYALATYTGIERHTKDLDIFLRRRDRDDALRALAAAGYRTEVPFPHWLAKAHGHGHFIDLIDSSGNGVSTVDDAWFDHAPESPVLGVPARLCPVEEMLWSKCFVMERERFDGADVAHLLRARGASLDWPRLLDRFGPHWRVLLAHLVLFGFIYPAERRSVPEPVLRDLLSRLAAESAADPPPAHAFNGTLISREQYLTDIAQWGYADPRLAPLGAMSPEEIAIWTEAIESKS